MFSNAHAHLRGDLEPVMKRVQDVGVALILAAGNDLQMSRDAIEVAKRYDAVYACVGIHPWNADKFDTGSHEKLRDLTREEMVVAISEIGLDFVSRRDLVTRSRGTPLPRDVQMKAFLSQVRLAKEVKLPIILHENESHSEILEILKREGASEVGGVIHGFRGSLAFARECISLGFYISFGRAITTPNNRALQEVVKEIPLGKLLTETDGGDPADVTAVATKIAELKRISVEEVGCTTTETLQTLLRL